MDHKAKGMKITKGGKEMKLPNKNQKRVQILKGLMHKLLRYAAWKKEDYNGEMLAYTDEQKIFMAIESLNYKGDQRIPQLIENHYLIPRSDATEDDLATFYLCPSKEVYSRIIKYAR